MLAQSVLAPAERICLFFSQLPTSLPSSGGKAANVLGRAGSRLVHHAPHDGPNGSPATLLGGRPGSAHQPIFGRRAGPLRDPHSRRILREGRSSAARREDEGRAGARVGLAAAMSHRR